MRHFVIAALLASVLPEAASATVAFVRVETASYATRFMRSVRDAGMGGTGIVDPASSASVAYNPANAVGVDGLSVFYQHDELPFLADDLSINDFGARYSRGSYDGRWSWGLALRHQRWAYDADISRTVFFPEGTGQTVDFDDKYTVASIAGAMARGPFRLALGVSGRHMSLSGFRDRSGWTCDVGTSAEWLWQAEQGSEVVVRCGASVLDLDNGIDGSGYTVNYVNMWRYGGGVEVRSGDTLAHPLSRRPARTVTLAFSAESVDQDGLTADTNLGIGAELGLAEMLYLRVGSVEGMPGFSDGVTWGVGLATDIGPMRFRADVARYPLNSFFEENRSTIFGFAVNYLP